MNRFRFYKKNKGMTLVEIMIAFGLGVVLLGTALTMWYFSYRTWAIERIRTKLRINLEIAAERLKEDVRLSSADRMSFYMAPSGTHYTAISFPRAERDSNGFFSLDANEHVYWDESVIYHIYEDAVSGDVELRRTVFTSNNSILTDESKRDSQLASVVADGDGFGAFNSANASTKTIFTNLVDLEIEPQAHEFDGYSPTLKRSDNVEFGSIALTSGSHDLKFEVTGKNADSSGYKFGIDTLSITPSGGPREAEVYTPAPSSLSGTSNVYAFGWSGNYYLKCNANDVGDFANFSLYYDLLRESNFANPSRINTVVVGLDPHVKLAAPTPGEGAIGCWQAAVQTGADGVDYPEAGETLILPGNVSIRNVIDDASLEQNGELVRFKLMAHSAGALVINEAWLVERAAGIVDDGTGTAQRLFFSDAPVLVGDVAPSGAGEVIGGTVGVTPTGATVTAGHYLWSNWIEMAIDETKDYFVTFSTPAANVIYWKSATPGAINSYFSITDTPSASIWNASTSSPCIYALEEAQSWVNIGTVTSSIYDTVLSAPSYNQINWTAFEPSGTGIVLRARSSNDSQMTGATAWTAIVGSGSNPHSLSIGSGRYVQFQATLSKSADYDDHANYPWIDNVTIDWPGQAKLCEISGYFTQAPDYGKIKLTVDGHELIKGLKFSITVYEDFRGDTYEDSLTAEVEPRNTGK